MLYLTGSAGCASRPVTTRQLAGAACPPQARTSPPPGAPAEDSRRKVTCPWTGAPARSRPGSLDLVEALLQKTVADLASRRRFPEATYRLQFHAGFTFRDARALVPYLHELGITDCYASPYLKSSRGSQHGYDVSDHRALNPEVGTEEEYRAWAEALRQRGMGQVLDVVPNHMGIACSANVWWQDVLENGPSSPYAGFFDIDWAAAKPDLHDKVLLPVLGDPYGQALEAGLLRLGYEAGAFTVRYFEHRFPLAPCTYDRVLAHRLAELEQALGATAEPFREYQSIRTALRNLPPRNATDPPRVAERHREKEVIKRRLAALAEQCPAVRAFLDDNVRRFNGRAGQAHSFDRLDDLLGRQAYRLACWRAAADEVNYRRFFDVNELAALSVEKPEVFAATHQLVLRLLGDGAVHGVRVDHPDGLYDPQQYLERLQQHFFLEVARRVCAREPEFRGRGWHEFEAPLRARLGRAGPDDAGGIPWRPLYAVVEKVLGPGEPLPERWPVHGTSGYEFLNALTGLFVQADNARAFSRLYGRWADSDAPFPDLVYHKKRLILQVSLSSELHRLAHQLDRLSEKDRRSRDLTLNSLRHALREVIACFPVYRSYIRAGEVRPRDRGHVETAVAAARHRNPATSAAPFDFVRDMLLLRYPEAADAGDRAEQVRFAGKFQQVTAPVLAKGLEDTTFYTYNRLLCLNEVGGDPDRFGLSPAAFHRHNQQRQARAPRALSATSTHDTKRSEDVRARLAVLSELPQEWQECLARWERLNQRLRLPWQGAWAPARNDEYLLYQTLVGAWPLGPPGPGPSAAFLARIQAYMHKAVHEAKVYTSWVNPNAAYDAAVRLFVDRLLDAAGNAPFLEDFRAFQQRVSHFGLFNALSQALLKIASPGVPDIYQGTELWDFSLVDPDNRRPVDYARRRRLLDELRREAAQTRHLPDLARRLTEAKEDGRIKLYVTAQALRCRRDYPGLFAEGAYLPAEPAPGPVRREHVCAFVRRAAGRWALAAVPRLLTRLLPRAGAAPLGPDVWQDSALLVPGPRPGRRCRNAFTGEVHTLADYHGQAALPLAQVFAHFPVALLVGQD